MAQPASHSVYLSPHFDDIAYSLGEWVSLHPGGTLLNIFTRSAYVARGAPNGRPTIEEIERISVLRDAEDRAFAEAAQLERICLGAEEPSLRGRKSRDTSGVAEDVVQIRAGLIELLDGFAAAGPLRLYCPAAIGGHVNHVATRAVVVDWIATAPREVTLLFYEDLPYSARWSVRHAGVRQLRSVFPGRLDRQSWRATEKKLAQIARYPSQVRELPTSLGRFAPAAIWPFGAHEAVWELKR